MPCSRYCGLVWDAEPLREVLRKDGSETIGDATDMLVMDETGFLT
ncbi:MAG: hypothetical protein NVS4B11_16110 [Ktedonobacteraceae bacterium]